MPAPKKQNRIVYLGIIAVLLPFAALILLEGSLRLFDYGEELALFVPASPAFGGEAYLRINPRVARRYFPRGHFLPAPTADGFLKHKPKESYRIFALGGSTTAGWPYPNNVMFTRLLQRRLVGAFPERRIEMVNLGMAAINSFALRDFIDEVLAERPDAILIYAGHNEFYGALGAASTVSFGASAAPIRLYLRLTRLRAFLLLRDGIDRAMLWIRRGAAASQRFPTLMGQVIGDDHIPLGSPTYESGKTQFRENLRAVLSQMKTAGVPVILSELVSNVRDHPPFLSGSGKPPSAAEEAFRNARRLESEGRIEAARAEYVRAKDLDGLRFRAPEEFNAIIHALAEEYHAVVVPMKAYFEAASPHGLVGKELMLEHLHPNARGHRLMSRAFLDAMHKHGLVSAVWDSKTDETGEDDGFTELDEALGRISVLHLTDHWPFKPEAEFSGAVERYAPRTRAEELAKECFLGKIGFDEAHMKMAEHYLAEGRLEPAVREYRALVNSSPLYVNNYLRAAQTLIDRGALRQAWSFLQDSLRIQSDGSDSAPLLIELAHAHLRNNELTEARRIVARLEEIVARPAGIEKLKEKLR